MRNAVIQTPTVEVICPHCGEPQPAPGDGSHMWLPIELTQSQGTKTCVSCEEKFRLLAVNRATVAA